MQKQLTELLLEKFSCVNHQSPPRNLKSKANPKDEEEKDKLRERLDLSSEIIKSFVLAGLNNTMNTYNGK